MNWSERQSPWARTVRRKRWLALLPSAGFAVVLFSIGPWRLVRELLTSPPSSVAPFFAQTWSAWCASFAFVFILLAAKQTWQKYRRILKDVPQTSGRVCPVCASRLRWRDMRGDGTADCSNCGKRFLKSEMERWWQEWGSDPLARPELPEAPRGEHSASPTPKDDDEDHANSTGEPEPAEDGATTHHAPGSDGAGTNADVRRSPGSSEANSDDAPASPPAAPTLAPAATGEAPDDATVRVVYRFSRRDLKHLPKTSMFALGGWAITILVIGLGALLLGWAGLSIAFFRVLIASSIGVLMLYLVRPAFGWERAGLRRCANCNYAAPPDRPLSRACPECGGTWGEPGGMRHGRLIVRVPWLAIAGLLVVALLGLMPWVLLSVGRVTTSMMPTALLLHDLNLDARDQTLGADEQVWTELRTRSLSDDTVRRLATAILNHPVAENGGVLARGGPGAWLASVAGDGRLPADLADRYFGGELRPVVDGPEMVFAGVPAVWRLAIDPGPHALAGHFAGRSMVRVHSFTIVSPEASPAILSMPAFPSEIVPAQIERDTTATAPGGQLPLLKRAAAASLLVARFSALDGAEPAPFEVRAEVEIIILGGGDALPGDALTPGAPAPIATAPQVVWSTRQQLHLRGVVVAEEAEAGVAGDASTTAADDPAALQAERWRIAQERLELPRDATDRAAPAAP